MEEQIGKYPKFSADECEKIRLALLAYKEKTGQSWAELSRQMTVVKKGKTQSLPSATLSVWGTGNYSAPADWIAAAVQSFFEDHEKRAIKKAQLPQSIGFIETQNSRLIGNQLFWSSMGKMTTTIGDPGLGKTVTLKDYCAKNPNSWSICLSPTRRTLKPVLMTIMRAMDITPISSDVRVMSDQIREYLTGRGGVLAIDEAQNLNEYAIEEIRAIHDETKVGIAFLGNGEVITRLEGQKREAAFAQRFSRNSIALQLKPPTSKDVNAILDAWNIDCQNSRNLLLNVAQRPGGGALRTLSNTLELATMLANQTGAARDFDLIKTAFFQTHQNETGVR